MNLPCLIILVGDPTIIFLSLFWLLLSLLIPLHRLLQPSLLSAIHFARRTRAITLSGRPQSRRRHVLLLFFPRRRRAADIDRRWEHMRAPDGAFHVQRPTPCYTVFLETRFMRLASSGRHLWQRRCQGPDCGRSWWRRSSSSSSSSVILRDGECLGRRHINVHSFCLSS